MNSQSFMYDDFSDSLMISTKKKTENVKGSIRILNLTLDISPNNKVVNVEMRKASDYLKSLGFSPKILNNLTDAEIVFKQCRDGYLISFILRSGKIIERVPYNIQFHKMPVMQ
jgi:uncharacterized protein YuzE